LGDVDDPIGAFRSLWPSCAVVINWHSLNLPLIEVDWLYKACWQHTLRPPPDVDIKITLASVTRLDLSNNHPTALPTRGLPDAKSKDTECCKGTVLKRFVFPDWSLGLPVGPEGNHLGFMEISLWWPKEVLAWWGWCLEIITGPFGPRSEPLVESHIPKIQPLGLWPLVPGKK